MRVHPQGYVVGLAKLSLIRIQNREIERRGGLEPSILGNPARVSVLADPIITVMRS